MRIVHLEDLLFEPGINVNDVVAGIQKRIFPVSIKWDGNPAFVAGNQPMFGVGKFIAFKSGYAKKVPELYTDNTFLKISDPDLRSRMQNIFDKLNLPENNIVSGELLLDHNMIDHNGEFQPNTVRYVCEDKQARFIVALHEVNSQRSTFLLTDSQAYSPPKLIYSTPYLLPTVDSYSDLTNSHKTLFKKWMNATIRDPKLEPSFTGFYNFYANTKFGKHIQDNMLSWKRLMIDYKYVQVWKTLMLDTLECDYFIQPAKGHNHEGLVVDIGTKLVKLVNREEFSRLNFNRERKYGRQSVS